MTALMGLLIGASSPVGASEEPLGQFRNTYYYVVFEADYPDEPKDASILTMEGALIAKVTPRFYKDLLVEGSARLKDGRMVNFAGVVEGKSRYHITKLRWGRGTGACALDPFRTIAADPTQIPAGALVKIAETVGMKLPNGKKSDGLWRAEDTGSAILHDRIDLFIGKRGDSNWLTKAGITHLKSLTVTLVRHPLPDSCVFKNPE